MKGIESLTKVTPKNLKQNSKIIKFDFTNFIYRIYHVSSLNIKSCLVDGKKVKFSTFFSSIVSNFNLKDTNNMQLLGILTFIENEVEDRNKFIDLLLKYNILKNKDIHDHKTLNKSSIAIIEFFNNSLVK